MRTAKPGESNGFNFPSEDRVDTELETTGGKDGVGAVNNIDRVLTEADGKVLLDLSKRPPMWSDYFPRPGPGGKPKTVWFDPDLSTSSCPGNMRS